MNLVVLTGAGVSAESGVPTFRGVDGLWEGHRIEDVASPKGFARDPQLVHRFYNGRRARLLDGTIHPNAAHLALAKLGRARGIHLTLVTQNIDDLHERAGSQEVRHLHGELLKARCNQCGDTVPGGLEPGVDLSGLWRDRLPAAARRVVRRDAVRA